MHTHDAPLASTAVSLRTGSRSIGEYLGTLADRVEVVEPEVHALLDEVGRWDRLDGQAAALEARYDAPADRPPLYGIPVGVKDIFHVDGFETRAGSDLPPTMLTGAEAESVSRLRKAGALVLGKTHTTEFAYFEPGPTRNPHDPAHTPGGSSSGSAAAVAAGLCPLALGTQTVGSVIRPAAFCGIVGFKPTRGRIPTDGVIPFSTSVDHVGLFTQDLAGARIAAPVLCDGWRTLPDPDERPVIGVPDGPYIEQAEPVGVDRFEESVDALDTAGFEVTRVPVMDDIAAVNDRHDDLTAADMALAHHDWFERYGDRYSDTTADLIREGREVSTARLAEGRSSRTALRSALETAMDSHGIDVWISPAAPGPAPEGIDSTGDPVMNLPWTHAGVPTVTVPAGWVGNLPVGLQCAARWMADEQLLAWAEAIAPFVGD